MATLKTNLIEPEGATTILTVGEAGGDLVIDADSLKANELKANDLIFSFFKSGSWVCPVGVTSVEYLVIGGGGGAGGNTGGGGGAGGYRTGTGLSVTAGNTYAVTVGAGGTRGVGSVGGTQGGSSIFSTITSAGGGGSSARTGSGPNGGTTGGSGGGGAGVATGSAAGFAGNTPSTSPAQGFAGGSGFPGATGFSGGGGGGASEVGTDGVIYIGGDGGDGISSSIDGTPTFRGGGGGGGILKDASSPGAGGPAGSGGAGGGGPGSNTDAGTPGTTNTGGGGGGGRDSNTGGYGGSGIVILKCEQPTRIFQSNGSGVVSSVNSGWGGVQVLLSTQTISAQASVVFTSGIDSSFDEYLFEFINIDGDTSTQFTFQVSTDGGSNYNITNTSTSWYSRHAENGTTGLGFYAGQAMGNSTAYQAFCTDISGDADASVCGEMHLCNPSSTSSVKNWYGTTISMQSSPGSWESFVGGYFNTTSAIDAISFKMNSGNITGTIKMYGIN